MRSFKEVMAELDATFAGRPSPVGFMLKREPDPAVWDAANPDKLARRAELEKELHDIERESRRLEAVRYTRASLVDSGLGERCIELVLANMTDTPAVCAVRDWFTTDKCWLVLSGDVGTGKSAAAGLALRMERERQILEPNFSDANTRRRPARSIAFRRAAALVRMSGFNEGAEELAKLKSVAMLVVDDLGTEHSTSWGNSLIHEIFDTRHDDKLRTIITTNIKRDALKAALGDRLADRIAQDGKVVFLEGKSMRRAPP